MDPLLYARDQALNFYWIEFLWVKLYTEEPEGKPGGQLGDCKQLFGIIHIGFLKKKKQIKCLILWKIIGPI